MDHSRRVFLTPRDAHEPCQWFDAQAATKYEEDTYFNGNNHISVATGCQWEHETLYKTATGSWIMYSYSNMQGSRESYYAMDLAEAVPWLIKNNHDPSDLGLTAEQLAKAEKIVADLEV